MAQPFAIAFDLPFYEAIAAAQARGIMLPDDYATLRAGIAKRAATTVSGLSVLDQIQRVIDSVTSALVSGQAFGDWQREAQTQGWELPAGRLETIFRTNIQTAYSAGHWRAFEANKARRPFLMYSAINDSRTRPAHLAMDGYIAPVDALVWRQWTPPCGYNCRCSQISLTESEAIARGYGRQTPPDVQPDPGFGDRSAAPGDIEAIIASAEQRRLGQVDPVLRHAYEQRPID